VTGAKVVAHHPTCGRSTPVHEHVQLGRAHEDQVVQPVLEVVPHRFELHTFRAVGTGALPRLCRSWAAAEPLAQARATTAHSGVPIGADAVLGPPS
jgi:hypothetical protein